MGNRITAKVGVFVENYFFLTDVLKRSQQHSHPKKVLRCKTYDSLHYTCTKDTLNYTSSIYIYKYSIYTSIINIYIYAHAQCICICIFNYIYIYILYYLSHIIYIYTYTLYTLCVYIYILHLRVSDHRPHYGGGEQSITLRPHTHPLGGD